MAFILENQGVEDLHILCSEYGTYLCVGVLEVDCFNIEWSNFWSPIMYYPFMLSDF